MGGTWACPCCNGFEKSELVEFWAQNKLGVVPVLKTLPVLKLVIVGLGALNKGVVPVVLLAKLKIFDGLLIALVFAEETVVARLEEKSDVVDEEGLALKEKVLAEAPKGWTFEPKVVVPVVGSPNPVFGAVIVLLPNNDGVVVVVAAPNNDFG